MKDVAIKAKARDGARTTRYAMRDARTGEWLTVSEQAGTPPAETREIGRALALSTNSVAVVLDALRAATVRSRSARTPLQFIVEVKPNGAPRIVAAPEAPDTQGDEFEIDAAEEAALGEALESARARGRHRVAEILAGQDMLTGEAFARHVDATRGTVNEWRQAQQVLALQGATRGYRYPVWQIGADGKPFAEIPQLFAIFGRDAWAVYRFLVQHHPELDGLSASEALASGLGAETVAVAEAVAEGTFA
ncbi:MULTISPECIES: DUF2384 domain-containing protein [Sphingobium]|nr:MULTISPECIES: DUF2384 domain-containing protein [Sphingobium]